jgi:hypothetical protein
VARIFISYRREDSDIWVSRLVDELRKKPRETSSTPTLPFPIPGAAQPATVADRPRELRSLSTLFAVDKVLLALMNSIALLVVHGIGSQRLQFSHCNIPPICYQISS